MTILEGMHTHRQNILYGRLIINHWIAIQGPTLINSNTTYYVQIVITVLVTVLTTVCQYWPSDQNPTTDNGHP